MAQTELLFYSTDQGIKVWRKVQPTFYVGLKGLQYRSLIGKAHLGFHPLFGETHLDFQAPRIHVLKTPRSCV